MNNDKLVKDWQEAIIKECTSKLLRSLTAIEKNFIKSRKGFIALEFIEDTVKTIGGKELEEYLNSESNE